MAWQWYRGEWAQVRSLFVACHPPGSVVVVVVCRIEAVGDNAGP